MLKLFLAAICLSPALSFAVPSHVVIIRHAEKSGNGLSSAGEQRAEDYVAYFTAGQMQSMIGSVGSIYAFRPEANSKQIRGVETVTPLSQAIKVNIDTTFSKTEVTQLVSQIMNDPTLDGQTILICWEHKNIAAVAAAFGVANPPKWKGQDYDHTWVVDLDGNGTVVSFHDLTQNFPVN